MMSLEILLILSNTDRRLEATEAEYIALTTAIKEALWLNQLLKELNRGLKEIKIMCDNKSTICQSKNP